MNRLFKLKKWLSLYDASVRLSSSIGEQVSVNDILQLALEEKIAISWLLNNQLVCEAEYSASLILGEADEIEFYKTNKLPSHLQHIQDEIPSHIRLEIRPFNSIVRMKDTTLSNGLSIIGKPFKTDGPYRIDLDTGAMKSIISDWLTKKSPDWIAIDGMILIGEDNKFYQPVELLPLSEKEKEKTGNYSIYGGHPFPTDKTPEISDIVIFRTDIEKFEKSLNEESELERSDTKKETLTISLGIMCEVLAQNIKKLTNGKKPNFSQLAKVIEQETSKLGIGLKEISNLNKELSSAYKKVQDLKKNNN